MPKKAHSISFCNCIYYTAFVPMGNVTKIHLSQETDDSGFNLAIEIIEVGSSARSA